MNFPCRVSIDLAEHEASLRDHEPKRFDETNDDDVKAIAPYELWEAIQALLLWRSALKNPHVKAEEVREEMIKDFDKLYRGCVSRWNDI